jgi:D-alanyl-D-alanine carboxypeptidase
MYKDMRLALLFYLCCFLYSPVQKDVNTDDQIGLNELKEEVIKIAGESNIPTLQLFIQTPGDSLKLSYHHPEVTAQSIYGIGSSTKLLASVLLFHLSEKGYINLQDAPGQYLDHELTRQFQGIESLTIKNLLNHTSGLADYTQNPSWITSVINNNSPLTFDDKIALVDSSLSHSPSFAYSNTNYLLLERIVEMATGRNYSDVFNQFYADNGLEGIRIQHDNQTLQAFFATDDKASSDVSMWIENYGFDGGAFSTADELNRFLQKLFIDKELLSENSLMLMREWIPMAPMDIPIGKGKIYGYGNGIMKLEYGEKTFIGHSGGTLKYQSFLFYDEQNDTTVVVLTNSSGRYYNNVFFQELIPAILDRL